MDKSEYEKSYNEALQIWDNLEYNKVSPYLEKNKCPMHPYYFFELSQVHNFNVHNGNNYKEYISIWKNKKNNCIYNKYALE